MWRCFSAVLLKSRVYIIVVFSISDWIGRRRRRVSLPSCHGPGGVAWYSTTERESAYRTVARRAVYRWHPWASRLSRVRNVVEKVDIAQDQCVLDRVVRDL